MLNKLENVLSDSLGAFSGPVMRIFEILLTFIIAGIIIKVGKFLIKKFFDKQKEFKFKLDEKRLDTMCTLLISVFKYAVYICAVIVSLSDILDLKAVLAAAGVGGVAIGLGAQSLIKDTISGFFILLEDQFAVGDLITIDDMTGTVERMELRVTRLKNYTGDLYIIPNGEIKKVTNHTRDNKMVIVDIPVAYSSNIAKVSEIAQGVCEEIKGEFSVFTEEPAVLGITDLGNNNFNLRITAKTLPNEQWAVERRIRIKIKEEFETNRLEFYDKAAVLKQQ
ncbi:small conductance mechanosensitive channel [Ruminiclostridium sufflavum DSM 19573]|uniref:Small conductance mechanosensitive channel n=1 Tax=Ruminiclostridium sufflavum DSM 19573 TaxID=1121337 RepID=A0A318XWM9_9FIRM|nr:mechanosensitive ion channel family protein [Ruminiclostridium sufflavum]PYG87207.1 small conductance mechanosensitive channel [Ruminiclostridium sufflavum DSM 19573]